MGDIEITRFKVPFLCNLNSGPGSTPKKSGHSYNGNFIVPYRFLLQISPHYLLKQVGDASYLKQHGRYMTGKMVTRDSAEIAQNS